MLKTLAKLEAPPAKIIFVFFKATTCGINLLEDIMVAK